MTQESDHIKEMLVFLNEQIQSARIDVACLLEVPMLRALGIFLEASIEQHDQVRRWAEGVLLQEVPLAADDQALALWMSCYRLFRRTVRIYNRHPDFKAEWFADLSS